MYENLIQRYVNIFTKGKIIDLVMKEKEDKKADD